MVPHKMGFAEQGKLRLEKAVPLAVPSLTLEDQMKISVRQRLALKSGARK